MERRYLVVPGLRSSRIHILDTKPDPRNPQIVKVIEPDEVADRAGYTRPHGCIAARRESTSLHSATGTARDPVGCS